MLLLHICLYNLIYINFSNILEKDVKREIGLFVSRNLSPFLWTGLIMAYFNLSWDIPEERDLLQIEVKG